MAGRDDTTNDENVPPTSEDRRGRDVWLLAGQDLLRAGGPPALKLAALTDRVGRTTGSFYHHFGSMDGYRVALARYFGDEQPATMLAGIDDPDPRRRLERLGRLSLDAAMHPLYLAMRDWATTFPPAADAVRAADRTMLTFVERAFRDLGFDRTGARARAELLFALGVVRVDPPWPRTARSMRAALAVLAPTD